MKSIPLTQGKKAIVDDDDFERLSQWNWYFLKEYKQKDGSGYAVRQITIGTNKQALVRMHREVMDSPKSKVDHKNGNKLDNRKENLRLSTHSQNGCNRGKQVNNSSGLKGVTWNKERLAWHAQIGVRGKRIHLGYFSNPGLAAMAYNHAAIKHHGEFAKLNEVVL